MKTPIIITKEAAGRILYWILMASMCLFWLRTCRIIRFEPPGNPYVMGYRDFKEGRRDRYNEYKFLSEEASLYYRGQMDAGREEEKKIEKEIAERKRSEGRKELGLPE